MRMGLKEANQNFSKAMKAVKAGKVVVLTERGKAIARIEPYREADGVEERLQQLIAEGVIREAKRPGPIRDNWKPIKMKKGGSITKTLREIRDEE